MFHCASNARCDHKQLVHCHPVWLSVFCHFQTTVGVLVCLFNYRIGLLIIWLPVLCCTMYKRFTGRITSRYSSVSWYHVIVVLVNVYLVKQKSCKGFSVVILGHDIYQCLTDSFYIFEHGVQMWIVTKMSSCVMMALGVFRDDFSVMATKTAGRLNIIYYSVVWLQIPVLGLISWMLFYCISLECVFPLFMNKFQMRTTCTLMLVDIRAPIRAPICNPAYHNNLV